MKTCLIVALCLTTLAAPAHARDERKDTAYALWREGTRYYNVQKFDKAIKLFLQAYEREPNPDILFNLAQCYRQTKDYKRALFHFRGYVRERPDGPQVDKVKALIEDLEELTSAQETSNKKPPGGLVDHKRKQPLLIDQPTRWHADPIGWTLSGVGVAATGVGIGLFFSGSGLENDAQGESDQPARKRLIDRAKSRKTLGTVFTLVGAATLAVGVVRLVIRPGVENTSTAVAVDVGPNWLGLSGRF